MHKKRLLKLADLLEADAKNKKGIKFSLTNWGRAWDENKPMSCGTTACAMGLAVASGAFRRAGLLAGEQGSLTPRMKNGSAGFEAAEELFGLTQDESSWLFLDSHYSGPTKSAPGERAVAKRIRAFVAGKAAP